MNFRKINNIAGWLVCLAACAVYLLTIEPGGSLWDCGEFVSTCLKLQIPHPPGAPLFVLLGRLFIVLFGDNPMTAAKAVNVMSAMASGFTILFLFWSITHFARRMVVKDKTLAIDFSQVITIIGAGVVGAAAYTFSDSFWFSAVEGEVYALSSFFTAIVFWAALKWEEQANEPGADKWLIFIFFLIGLSIGVHLLCLLCIPAIVMIYYFKKAAGFNYARLRKYFIRSVIILGALGFIGAILSAQGEANEERGIPADNTVAALIFFGALISIAVLFIIERVGKARKTYYGGAYIFLVLSVVILGIVQVGLIQYTVKVAGSFDVFFVNNLGLPFFSGFAFFFILLAVLIWFGLRYAGKKDLPYLRLSLWGVAFILIGYSMYITTMLRSNADPGIDVFNVDNPQSLAGYLGREQYGDFPILYGQKFNAQPVDYKEESEKFQKGEHKYISAGKRGHYVFMPQDKMVFPRMWDMTNDQNHADYYAFFMNVGKLKDGSYAIDKDENGLYTKPGFYDNMRFFLNYQTSFMYLRYFLWNFSGRQNDIEGVFSANVRDGNWITGIPFVDNSMYGDQKLMPDSLKQNKGHNKLFMLPLVLGLLGLFFQYKKNKEDAFVSTLLFFMTGFAIIIYLNQPGFQPRERDYAYVGSFYAFSIWIGLAVPFFAEMIVNRNMKMIKDVALYGLLCSLLIVFTAASGNGGAFVAGVGFVIVFMLTAIALPSAFRALSNKKAVASVSFIVAFAVPVWMAIQEWDDHDRSHKQTARDLAKDYLESCAPNAILFSYGDNDTYPLWYAQEVEGIRPDVRVVITSLLASDWNINQLRYKINNSDPVDVIWSKDQIEGGKRDFAVYRPQPQYPENKFYDLYSVMKNYVGDDRNVDERGYNIFPVRSLSIPVDEATVRANGTVNKNDSIVKNINFTIPTTTLYKNHLAILSIIAANQWKRPIYFTMPYSDLGFGEYFRRDGLAYRLVPVLNSNVNTARMTDVVMNKFGFGNASHPNVYFDEENRRQLSIIRRADAELSLNLFFEGKKEEARRVVQYTDKMIPDTNMPYGMVSRGNDHNRVSMMMLEACYRAEDNVLADKIYDSVKRDLDQQIRYYDSLDGNMADAMEYEKNNARDMLSQLNKLKSVLKDKKPVAM
ncbi:DUF2723 domain-containing protein [Danxiaibacter flavus]|uniref:DUF2723 domain-containing protein n=1 Tax=Danxiaibacter flavus TaxID=3049108 RepID=A0ABV3ZAA9_9BACT|nr:DUF2723 domain-containing protein [Chitinophagaceae bacterium DXS]